MLSASDNDDTVAWYENVDGLGSFGPKRVITDKADRAHAVFATDVDGDGDVDAISVSRDDNRLAWYDNGDGRGGFLGERAISSSALEPTSAVAADVDRDGDPDALVADNGASWHANTDATGSFGPPQVIMAPGDAYAIVASDVDGDGDLDAVTASRGGDTIAWHENSNGSGSFGPPQVITAAADGAVSVFAADIDGGW